jgi:hypothetical protein
LPADQGPRFSKRHPRGTGEAMRQGPGVIEAHRHLRRWSFSSFVIHRSSISTANIANAKTMHQTALATGVIKRLRFDPEATRPSRAKRKSAQRQGRTVGSHRTLQAGFGSGISRDLGYLSNRLII